MHHFLSAEPLVKFGEGRFEIGLMNGITGELVTISGQEQALVDGRKEGLSYEDVDALGRYLAVCLSRWERQGGSAGAH